jgi:hypothetical protein
MNKKEPHDNRLPILRYLTRPKMHKLKQGGIIVLIPIYLLLSRALSISIHGYYL